MTSLKKTIGLAIVFAMILSSSFGVLADGIQEVSSPMEEQTSTNTNTIKLIINVEVHPGTGKPNQDEPNSFTKEFTIENYDSTSDLTITFEELLRKGILDEYGVDDYDPSMYTRNGNTLDKIEIPAGRNGEYTYPEQYLIYLKDKNDQDSGDDEGNPGDDEGNPGDDEGNPGDDEGNPGDDEGNPGDDEGNPGDDEGNPGGDEGNPGDDESNPGDDEGNPGDDEGNPGDDEGNPGDDDGSTGETETPGNNDNEDNDNDEDDNTTKPRNKKPELEVEEVLDELIPEAVTSYEALPVEIAELEDELEEEQIEEVEEVDIDEVMPVSEPTLPKTGSTNPLVYSGIGSILLGIGLFLKKKQ